MLVVHSVSSNKTHTPVSILSRQTGHSVARTCDWFTGMMKEGLVRPGAGFPQDRGLLTQRAQGPQTVLGDQRELCLLHWSALETVWESFLSAICGKNHTSLAFLIPSSAATWLSCHHSLEHPKAVSYASNMHPKAPSRCLPLILPNLPIHQNHLPTFSPITCMEKPHLGCLQWLE